MLPREVSSIAGEPNRRDAGQRGELGRGDHAAGQPDTREGAVGGLVHLQRTRAGVVRRGICSPVHGTAGGNSKRKNFSAQRNRSGIE